MNNVNLVSCSYPNIVGLDNLTDLIVYCARVSSPVSQNHNGNGEKLIQYLIQHQHWSPFEMVNICLEIETTRDIARQILRHRSFSFQEFSQRYSIADLGYVTREARLQDHRNRQNSIETIDVQLHADWEEKQHDVLIQSIKSYDWAIEHGIAKEQARAVLPEGMTLSRMYMNGSLRSWIHYIQLRSGNGTQKEHRAIALLCKDEIRQVFPLIDTIITIEGEEEES